MISTDEVVALFKSEFLQISDRFSVFQLSVEEARSSRNDNEARPGVYVYWHPDYGVVKSGKSQANSRKRALEHIRDNTSSNEIEMRKLGEDTNTVILLFNINHDSDLHWVLALEAFMEWNANPQIKSARMG